MAVVSDGMPCILCGMPLDSEDCFTTTHFLGPSHPLARYSDSAMHWSCHDAWPARHIFAKAHFDAEVTQLDLNPYWRIVYRSERVAVTVSMPPPERVRLTVSARIIDLEIDITDWEELVSGQMPFPHLREADLTAVVEILPEVQVALPSSATVRRLVG